MRRKCVNCGKKMTGPITDQWLRFAVAVWKCRSCGYKDVDEKDLKRVVAYKKLRNKCPLGVTMGKDRNTPLVRLPRELLDIRDADKMKGKLDIDGDTITITLKV